MERQPTVFLVDDDPYTRDLVRDLSRLMNLPCEYFGSGEDFLNACDGSRPGCVLLEIQTSGLNGLQVQRHLTTIGATLPVIFATAQATVSIAVQAIRNGAVGFLEKPLRQHELWDAVQDALRLDAERRSVRSRQELLDTRIARLTESQRGLMQMIADGRTNQDIARQLGLCLRTIEKRRTRLMETLQATSLMELLYLALYARNRQLSSQQGALPQAWGQTIPPVSLLR